MTSSAPVSAGVRGLQPNSARPSQRTADPRPLAASSKNVYATGVASSVSNSDSSWPMTTGPAVARLNSAPMPCDVTSGNMPATNANVVIRMGRNRSRLPCMIAS